MKRLLRAIAAFRAALREEGPPSSVEDGAVGSMGDEPQTNRSYIGISLVIAVTLIAAVGGGLLWQFNRHQQQNEARHAYAQAIAKLWKDERLLLDDTRKFLEDQPVLADGKTLLKSHEAFFRSMRRVLDRPEQAAARELPSDSKDDLASLKKLLDEWSALHATPWAKLQAEKNATTEASIYEAFRQWEDSRNATWKKLTSFLELHAPPPPSDELLQPLKAIAKAALSREEPARETRTTWVELFEIMANSHSPVDADVQRWLALWKELDGPTPRAAADKNFADTTLPAWLLAKAAEVKQRHEKDGAKVAETKPESADKPKETQKPKSLMEDADAVPAKHDIHVCLLKPGEDPIGKITGLKVAADMLLYVGDGWDAHPIPEGKAEPKNGELQPWVAASLDGRSEIYFGPSKLSKLPEMIRISSSGTLLGLPEQFHSPANGLRLVGRSKDMLHVLFDLRLIPLRSVVAKPILAKEVPALADNFSTATLRLPEGFIPRLHLLGLTRPVYALRLDGAVSEQKIYDLKHTVDSSFELIPPQAKTDLGLSLQKVRQQIADLEADIQKIDAELAAIDPKLPAQTQEDRKEIFTKVRTEKESQLQSLRPQLQSMEAQMSVHFDLMPGRYTLLLEQPYKLELCKLNVTAPNKFPSTKPSTL